MEECDFSNEGIILVLGVTGTGKSYFLNQLKRHSIVLDEDDMRSITVVDTPGFDDTMRPDGEVLTEITEFLAAQHALGVPLRGVLYFHRITDDRVAGSSMTYLRLLESLVGSHALENLILVTTMWNRLRDEDIDQALRREQELIDKFWRRMEDGGSSVAQFDGTADSAYALVFQLAGKQSVVLEVQKEIVDEDQTMLATAVGSNLLQQLEEHTETYQIRAAELESRLDLELKLEPRNKKTIQQLRNDKADVDKILRQITSSRDRMMTRPGLPVKERIKRAMEGSGKNLVGSPITILAAVLNLTLFVVRLGLGGGP
ncbi:hypothetical protein QQS21_005171 [Conoideocrella luteorostrata]|uniref:AIG1-type G domain-containing protein n=1 Tax=Conoideocrella luteorostrata TaxID=1105319 RepID=A0AAJ0CPX5_9HYPO|nr:hypothetical protein QQS21_005171 [Conoideocrella luteorostrata]